MVKLKHAAIAVLVTAAICISGTLIFAYKRWHTPPAFELVHQATVTRVLDGDTLEVKAGGHDILVRLMGIQAPETNQCHGSEATKQLQAFLNKRVRIEFLPRAGLPIQYDMYGQRALAYLYMPDGKMFNLEMIRQGHVHEFTNSGTYEHRHEFQTAHCNAREQKRGMWSSDSCAQESLKGRKRACLR